jgi:UPF0176 protein
MEKEIHILLFYKYVEIEDFESFRDSHLADCKDLGLKGRILVAREGINGSVAGTKEKTEAYKKLIRSDERFNDLVFKEDLASEIPFKKMQIKVKKNIVGFGEGVDLSKTGTRLTPKEFLDLYDSGGNVKDENTIIVDGRNGYEAKVGRFKGAICPEIEEFNEFDKVAEQLADKKDKKIVMYCTGGIRCEKATAHLKEKGFKDVSQLHGGILTFGKEFPDTVWEGKCMVFDKRLLSRINSEDKDEKMFCEHCEKECEFYKDCRYPLCNRFCFICNDCDEKYAGACSVECFDKYREWKTDRGRAKKKLVC